MMMKCLIENYTANTLDNLTFQFETVELNKRRPNRRDQYEKMKLEE